jgi:hypothetical protein
MITIFRIYWRGSAEECSPRHAFHILDTLKTLLLQALDPGTTLGDLEELHIYRNITSVVHTPIIIRSDVKAE